MAALVRRHLVAVAIVFICAVGLMYHFQHEAQGYIDTATVAFTAPTGPKGQTDLFEDEQSLLVIDALTANSAMSQQGEQQVRDLGGTATYDVALVNLNDEDYPNYSDPYVTVTTSSFDAAAAQHTFLAVMRVLQVDLATLQARQGANPATWIQLHTIASPSGPIAQTGSRKRSLAGLATLAVISAFMLATFLDRHPVRLSDLPGRRLRL
jgi:hypothetical protein